MQQFKNEGLDRYAQTDADRAVFRALVDCGGDYEAMAQAIGITVGSVRSRLSRLRKRAALRGWSPTHDVAHPTPEGFHLKGTSTLYGADGEIKAQWVKTDKDREDRLEAMRIACDELAAPIRGCIPRTRFRASGNIDDKLMAAYLIGDHHLGMYSWAEETGADYDCKIAEQILQRAFDRLTASAPRARRGLVVSIGDFFHADNSSARTPQSGHALDTDSRHSYVIQTGIRMLKRAVRQALARHELVDVDIVPGNHDPESSMWLAYCLAEAFSDEPRVTVNTSPRAYHYIEHGSCLIGTAHGDKCKPTALGEIMSVECREQWARAKHCHWYTGHVHHKWAQELRGCEVESLSVLCPSDDWHARSGYRSKRGMQMDVWHADWGRVTSQRATVEYING
jgi:hypothetical protein